MTQTEFNFAAQAKHQTLMQQFETFHKANPHVYDSLVSMAYTATGRGMRQCSIAMLFEVLRWQINVETNRTSEFKISNSLRAPYARKIMADHPRLAGVFNLKKSVVDPTFCL
jgi:hypothetical protein